MSEKKIILDRTNTNFSVELLEFLKKLKFDNKYDFLLYYQNIIREILTKTDFGAKGMLINFYMGMGKSIMMIAIAMEYIHKMKILMVMAKSLQNNMKEAIKQYIDMRVKYDPDFKSEIDTIEESNKDTKDTKDNKNIYTYDETTYDIFMDKYFKFVSMNASNMIDQIEISLQEDIHEVQNKAMELKLKREFKMAEKKRKTLNQEQFESDNIEDFNEMKKKIAKINTLENLNGVFVFVDEAHDLFRAITNGSKNAVKFYNLIRNSPKCRVIFATGSIISNDPYEAGMCFNMLSHMLLFPESYEEFNQLFINSDGTIKNREKFQNRIFGLVSSVDLNSKLGASIGLSLNIRKAEFPTRLPLKIILTAMSYPQYSSYLLVRDKELEEAARSYKKKSSGMFKAKSSSSTYRVGTRMISNYAPHVNFKKEKDPYKIPEKEFLSNDSSKMLATLDIIKFWKEKKRIGYVYSSFVGIGGLGSLQRYLDLLGAEEYNMGIDTHNYVEELEENLEDTKSPEKPNEKESPEVIEESIHDEIPNSGILDMDESNEALKRIYKVNKRKQNEEYKGQGENDDIKKRIKMPKIKYAVIRGDIPQDIRHQAVQLFKSPENKHGEYLDLLLISKTGSQGIDFKNIGYGVIIEPYWTWSLIEQIIARAIRNDSHILLKDDEKFVQIYLLLSIPPIPEVKLKEGSKLDCEIEEIKTDIDYLCAKEFEFITDIENPTTDIDIYNGSIRTYNGIKTFSQAMREVSVECLLNDGENCRKCAPNSEKLFTDDINGDIVAQDPCRSFSANKVTAREIILNGATYYYTLSPPTLFQFDEKLNAYKRVGEGTILREFIEKIADITTPEKIK